jgi:hypothetical protein
MSRAKNLRGVIATIVLLASAAISRGDSAPGTITITGHAIMKFRTLTMVRMILPLRAEGTDIHEALANLKIERDELGGALDRNFLEDFSDPIEVRPHMDASASWSSTRPSTVIVESTLDTEIEPYVDRADTEKLAASIVGDDPALHRKLADEALEKSVEIEDKIKQQIEKARDKARKKLASWDPADETTSATAIGEPRFVYVRILGQDEQLKLMSDAFSDAQSIATWLAQTANKTIGKATQITSANTAAIDPFRNLYLRSKMRESGDSAQPSTDCWVAFSTQRNNLAYSLTLTVTFEMKDQ